MIIINKYHVQCELVKEIFAVYTKGFNVKIFPCLSRYKICLVTKTREFTKDILKRAIIKYINVILDIDNSKSAFQLNYTKNLAMANNVQHSEECYS